MLKAVVHSCEWEARQKPSVCNNLISEGGLFVIVLGFCFVEVNMEANFSPIVIREEGNTGRPTATLLSS